MTAEDLQILKLDLTQEMSTLERELDTFARKNPQVKGDYQTRFPKGEEGDTLDERAHSVEEYEKDRELEHNLELKLRDIKESLKKIEAGTYGICDRCQNSIDDKRLKATIVARFCVNCANIVRLL